jgi:hypothetical protein
LVLAVLSRAQIDRAALVDTDIDEGRRAGGTNWRDNFCDEIEMKEDMQRPW